VGVGVGAGFGATGRGLGRGFGRGVAGAADALVVATCAPAFAAAL